MAPAQGVQGALEHSRNEMHGALESLQYAASWSLPQLPVCCEVIGFPFTKATEDKQARQDCDP